MDFSQVKLNCSRLGVVMSEPKGALTDKMFEKLEWLKGKEQLTDKQEVERIELQFRMDNYNPKALSQGCMLYLMFLYQYHKYGKQIQFSKKQAPVAMVKGTRMEKSSLEIIKRVTGYDLYRYKSKLSNDRLKGQLDVIDAQHIDDSTKIIDIKTSYSQFDFMKKVATEANRKDCDQMQGYFAITGKDNGEIYYTLADFTEDMIQEQRVQLLDLLCPDGHETEYFIEEWSILERSMRFDHIPDEERIIVQTVERDDKYIGKIYEKVDFCREWLAEFESKHKKKIADQLEKWKGNISYR